MAEELKLENFDERNMKACCCFHSEDTPSLIYNRKNYTFHCFGCQKTVDIIDVYMMNGATYLEAVQKLFELVGIKYAFGEKGVKTQHQYRYPNKEEPADEKVYQYLKRRGISKSTVDYVDIGHNNGAMAFHYYDTNDVLTLVKYRPARAVKKGENKSWCQKDADTSFLLFNMNRINTDKQLIICEGEIDCMSAIEAGITNAVSVPFGAGNFQWIEHNWEWLEQFNSIVICADADEAGRKMQAETIYRLGSWRTKIVDCAKEYEDDKGDVHFTKDLNEILRIFGKEAVAEVIRDAKETPVDTVSDFSDIKNLDVDDIGGIETGIKTLDQYIMKLFYGTFNIVTGVNGSGKSSLLSQLICRAVENGQNAFLYSGELPNFQSKNWINYIFAGQRNLFQRTYLDTPYWKVTQEAQEKIDEHYRGQIFVYKDGYDHKVDSLMQTMENVVRKYGVKMLVIDNLTSVNLEANDNNKYARQEEFITRLITFAKKYNVVVILVVHPHKLDTMRRMNKMDIQGISAIIDLAHRIFSLYRVSDEDKKGKEKQNGKGWWKEPIPYDVICDILKDRMLGFEGKSVGLYYDRPSRRFFENEKDLDFQFNWDKTNYTSDLPYPPMQLYEQKQLESEVFGA